MLFRAHPSNNVNEGNSDERIVFGPDKSGLPASKHHVLPGTPEYQNKASIALRKLAQNRVEAGGTDKALTALWKAYEKNHTNPKAGDAEKRFNQHIFRTVEKKYGTDTAKAMYGTAEALRRSGVKAMHHKYGIEEMIKEQGRVQALNELVSVVRNRLPPQDNFIDRAIRNSIAPETHVTELEKKQKATANRMLRARASYNTERGVARSLRSKKHILLRAASLKVPPIPKVPDVEAPKPSDAVDTSTTTPKAFHSKPIVK